MKLRNIIFTVLITLFTLSITTARLPVSNSLTDFYYKHSPLIISLFSNGATEPDVYRVVKFGHNEDIDLAAPEDIQTQGGQMVFPSAAETLSIVSDSAADDSGSTGANSIYITCIQSDGTRTFVTVTMDGTTPVVTTQTCLFVNRATVLLSGSGKVNAGNITITNTSSGNVLAYIEAGEAVTHQAVYRVPSNYNCFINSLYLASEKLAASDPRVIFKIKVFNTATTNTEYVIRREGMDTNSDSYRIFNNFKDQALLPR